MKQREFTKICNEIADSLIMLSFKFMDNRSLEKKILRRSHNIRKLGKIKLNQGEKGK